MVLGSSVFLVPRQRSLAVFRVFAQHGMTAHATQPHCHLARHGAMEEIDHEVLSSDVFF